MMDIVRKLFQKRRRRYHNYLRAVVLGIKRIRRMTYQEVLALHREEPDTIIWTVEVDGEEFDLELNILEHESEYVHISVSAGNVVPFCFCSISASEIICRENKKQRRSLAGDC